MHQIARHLPEYHCYFTPYFADGLLGFLGQWGFLDFTVLGGPHRHNTEAYLKQHHLPVDFGGQARDYDLILTCSDLLVQKNIRGKPVVLVQEGITEPEGVGFSLVRTLHLPPFLANTAAMGLSDTYDVFCVASPGYRDLFVKKGVRPEKIAVTGIPNFDFAEAYRTNDFPYQHYVLAMTSSHRELFTRENRVKFIQETRRIAGACPENGQVITRQLIFKLHPNEDHRQAIDEIRRWAPEALIFRDGNTGHMIANCDVLVTQYSSVVFIGLALGKEVHSLFDLEPLRKLTPIQNGGTSARRIAEICHHLISSPRSMPERTNGKKSGGYKREVRPAV
jgi:hypothetical protein